MYKNLKKEMKKRHANQGVIAKMLGVSQQSLSGKMTGKHEFKLTEMQYIKQILNSELPLDELFKYE